MLCFVSICLYHTNSGQYETFDKSTMLSFRILVVLLSTLVCVIIGIIVVLRIRLEPTAEKKRKSNNKQRPGNLLIKEEKNSLPLSQFEQMYDEKNPDVVSLNEGKNINFMKISLTINL